MHRVTILKPANLACGVILSLFLLTSGSPMPAAAQAQTDAQPAAQPRPTNAPAPVPTAAGQLQGAPQAGPRGAAPAGVRGSDRRRPSYASCNRASQARGLRGGARRRFLIRCKLGYERPRPSQAGQPQVPGRQP